MGEAFAMFRKEKAMISLSEPTTLGEGDDQKIRMFLVGALHSVTLGKLDWENRISVSFDHNDCAKVLYGLKYKENIDLYHQYGDKPAKTVKMNFNDGKVSLIIGQGSGDSYKSVFVNLQPSDFVVLEVLLAEGIKRILGWS